MADRPSSKQYAFYFDQTRCMGCQTCVVACKDWNNLKAGNAKLRNMHDVEEGKLPNLKVFNTIYACNHCEIPACIPACPYKAITKRKFDGIVVIDPDKCQGNGACKTACPYDAPQIPDENQAQRTLPATTGTKGFTMMKCNMCWDRVSKGMKPSCVNSCLTRALDFGTIEELTTRYPDAQTVKTGTLKGFPTETKTNPSFLFKPKM